MSLEQIVNEQMKEAMKSGDKVRLDTVRMLRAAIIEFNKSGAALPMSAEDEQKILMNAAKKRRDAIEMYRNAGRADLLEKEEAELAIIMSFLPKQLSEQEIEQEIQAIIGQTGANGPQDMGKVMGPAMKSLRGRAEGALVQTVVKRLLGA
jgi:uncharacterized protein YqeY